MRIFGLEIGKPKAVPFQQFRDRVRAAARHSSPGATAQVTDNGFILTLSSGKQQNCNLRQLYADYCKDPGKSETLINDYITKLVVEIPEQGWIEARSTLRPVLKDIETLHLAKREMDKQKSADSLPAEPFVGDLYVTVARELMGTLTYVTEAQLQPWGVPFAQVLEEAKNNLNMHNFPPVVNEMRLGGSKRGANDGDVIGVVFEGDHLTATWLILDRFRDFLSMKLQGDYVVFVPNRSHLVAVRVDEPGLIASMIQSNRNYRNQPYALTSQGYLVSAATTGGVVSVYQGSNAAPGQTLSASSPFAAGSAGSYTPTQLPNLSQVSAGQYARPLPIDFSAWGGLSEPTADAPPSPQKGKS